MSCILLHRVIIYTDVCVTLLRSANVHSIIHHVSLFFNASFIIYVFSLEFQFSGFDIIADIQNEYQEPYATLIK